MLGRRFSWLLFLLFLFSPNLLAISRFSSAHRPNVVLIVLDSLRRDHLGFFGYSRPTSPFLDELARSGVVFRNVVAASSQTGPAVASLFTGLYPSHHGCQFYSFKQSFHPIFRDASPHLDESLITMAEIFQQAGANTLALVCNPWLKPENGFAQGFSSYVNIDSWDGRNLNAAFLRLLASGANDQPFFIYLHYMDTHAPYYSTDRFRGLFTPFKGDHVFGMGYKDYVTEADIAYSVALYDEEIRQADDLIREVVTALRGRGLLDRTLIIITADHGEEFSEHQGFGHGTTLYEEQIGTFFIFYGPALVSSKEIGVKVASVDLFPTVLDIAGLPQPSSIDGQSLLALWQESPSAHFFSKYKRFFFSELADKKAVHDERWKYIWNPFLLTEELYDLRRDYKEKRNRVDDEPKKRAELKRIALGLTRSSTVNSGLNQLPTETIERLRSLGYLTSSANSGGSEERNLSLPISPVIDFNQPQHNPLQLIYGWGAPLPLKEITKRKGQEKGVLASPQSEQQAKETEARSSLREALPSDQANSLVSPLSSFAKWVLASSSPGKRRFILQGYAHFPSSPNNTPLVLDLFCDGEKLAEWTLSRSGPFLLTALLPSHRGHNRSLEFTLIQKTLLPPSPFTPRLLISLLALQNL